MRRFILIDPCLGDRGSHPYHYCLEVLDAAARAGFACEAVVQRRFRVGAGEWPDRHELTPVIDVTGYSKYAVSGDHEMLREDGTPRLRLTLPWASRHAERRRHEYVSEFARSITASVTRVAPDDIVLLATATELDVAGLALAIRAAGGPPSAGWHALFHYPLYRGCGADFPRQERRLDRLRCLLAEAVAVAAPARIRIHVTTAELQAHYARLGVGPIGILPYPVRAIRRDARAGRGGPLRVVALGDARPEKGSDHLAAVVERLEADPALRGRFTLAIQSNLGFVPRWRDARGRAVQRALRRLAALERDPAACLVELIPGPLTDDAYHGHLAAADATILPYDQDRYRARCSGVLLEALASGVVPIVTGGGSMGRMLAGPHGRHVEALVTRSMMLASERHGPFRTHVRHPWQATIRVPAATTAVIVAIRFAATGADALVAPPAVIELDCDRDGRSAALVTATADGLGTAVLPVEPPMGRCDLLRLRVAPGAPGLFLNIVEVTVTALDSQGRPPCGAAGIVVPPGGDIAGAIVGALRELAHHPDHYIATALENAAAVSTRHAGARVIETLLATCGQYDAGSVA